MQHFTKYSTLFTAMHVHAVLFITMVIKIINLTKKIMLIEAML